ncbi:hypothetical protein ACYOEI_00030 [Singulisphaera rosea]
MPAAVDQKVRIILESQGEQFLDVLKGRLDLVNGSIDALNDSFTQGIVPLTNYRKDVGSLAREQDNLTKELAAAQRQLDANKVSTDAVDHAMEELAASSGRASSSFERTGSAAAATTSKMSPLSQRIQAGTYAFQDFTSASGDLGQKLNAITNNIPGLLAGFGNFGYAVSLIITGAVALYKNWRAIATLWEDRHAVKTANDLKGLEDQLDRTKDKIQELEKATKDSNGEMSMTVEEQAKYNDLKAEQVRLEKEVSAEKKRQHEIDELLQSRSKEDRERGQAFEDAAAGRGARLRSDVQKALVTRAGYDVKREEDRMGTRVVQYGQRADVTHDQYLAFAQTERAKFDEFKKNMLDPALWQKATDDLLVKLKAGDKNANARLTKLMDAGTGVLIGGNGFRKAWEDQQPEAVKARKEAEEKAKVDDRQAKAAARDANKQNKKESAADIKAYNAMVDQWNKEDGDAIVARKNQAKADAKTSKGVSKAREKEIKEGATKLEKQSGKNYGLIYENEIAQNEADTAQGAPVVTSFAQERQMRETGQKYALPPEILKNRIKKAMTNDFFQRGGSAAAAQKATENITGKAESDLEARRNNVANKGMNAQGRILNVAMDLAEDVAKLEKQQNMIMQGVAQLENSQKQKKRSNLRRGR